MNTRKILICAAIVASANLSLAEPMTSTNYGVAWSVVDSGGGPSMSANYGLESSVAQPSALGTSASTGYEITPGFFATPDSDVDLVRDFMDNCIYDANTSQLDSNGDGYGNLCDPDLNNSGAVNFADYAMLTSAFLSTPASAHWNPDADLTGDDRVNFADIALFQFFFLQAPGPSALAP